MTMTDKEILAQAKELIRNIRLEKQDIDNRRKALERNFRDEKAGLEHELSVLQDKCPHMNTDYQPDASGNNDSTTTCLDCGKSGRRI